MERKEPMKNFMIVLGLVLLIGIGYLIGHYYSANSGRKVVDYPLIGEAQNCEPVVKLRRLVPGRFENLMLLK